MSDRAEDMPLRGRLAKAVESICDESLPTLPLERVLSRARALEPRAAKSPNGRSELWRNRISSLFDQLEDRDLLTTAALCCVAPADPPMTTQSTVCPTPRAIDTDRRGASVLSPSTYSAGGEAWAEALEGLWSEDEELAVGAVGNDWIATSTACADWTWPS